VPVGLFVPRTGVVIAGRVRWATTPRERARGLLSGPPLGPGEALVIEPARQLHSFGMQYAIDVCFCDRDWRVFHPGTSFKPRRLPRWVRGARYGIETPAGALAGVERADQVSLSER